MDTHNDSFELYDLKVVIIKRDKPFVCSHKEGDYFEVIGENLVFNQTNSFSMYALSALLPLLPVKQRMTDKNDWITTDSDIACPDPHCGAVFRIHRMNKRLFKHSQVTKIPLQSL